MVIHDCEEQAERLDGSRRSLFCGLLGSGVLFAKLSGDLPSHLGLVKAM